MRRLSARTRYDGTLKCTNSAYPPFVPAAKYDFSAGPEVFRVNEEISDAVRRAVARGEAAPIGNRLYTRIVHQPVEEVVRRNVWEVVRLLVPGAVVVDRTAFSTKPAEDGSICVAAGTRRRVVELPGLRVRVRPGGPVEGDVPFMGIRMSSDARRYLDNLRSARARAGFKWTIDADEVEQRLDRFAAQRGEAALNELRDQARALAPALDAGDALERLDRIVGALLGTREGRLSTPEGRAGAAGMAYDREALGRLNLLAAVLNGEPPALRTATASSRSSEFSFWEAYFSNYIEGTVFAIGVAHAIVFEGYQPPQRSADAHDITGTFRLANDVARRARVAADAKAFLEILLEDHATLMAGRPDKRPGQFKEEPNQAGNTRFVDPGLVRGTLQAGFETVASARRGLARAILMMFLVAEVHPFDDGNGRTARLRMNAELSAADEQRIIVPTGFRSDYLGALRRLSRQDDPTVLVRTLDRAQAFSAEIEWAQARDAVERQLERSNAFHEEEGSPLRLPSELPAVAEREGAGPALA